VERQEHESTASYDAGDKGQYRHFMLKEIHEQPQAVMNTLEGRLSSTSVLDETFGNGAAELFKKVKHIQIVACGTSYHSAMVERQEHESTASYDAGDKGQYRHFMLKEIHEQPQAVMNTLEGRLSSTSVLDETFGNGAAELFKKVKHIQIVACGTSYHSAMVAR